MNCSLRSVNSTLGLPLLWTLFGLSSAADSTDMLKQICVIQGFHHDKNGVAVVVSDTA